MVARQLLKVFIVALSLSYPFIVSGGEMLSHFSASPEDVQQASCKKKMPMSDGEIIAWIANKEKSGKLIPQKFMGSYNFINQNSALLDIFEHLQVKPSVAPFAYSVSKDFSYTEVPLTLKNFAVSRCQTVICALEELYGAKAGLRIFYILGEYEYNVSSAQFKNARPFTLTELDTLTMGLADIPTFLRRKNINNPLYAIEATGPYGNSTIQLLTGWTLLSTSQQNAVVYHEFSHNIAEANQKIDRSNAWIQLSGWRPEQVKNTFDFFDKTNWLRTNTENCLSGYACYNPVEYFAEAFTSFRYSPKRLQKMNLEIYEFLKRYYQQSSYLSDETCKAYHPEYVRELPTYQALKKQMDEGISALFEQNSSYDKELKQICFQRVTGGKSYPFSQAKAMDMKTESCMNQEIFKTLKIESKEYSADELILGLQPLDAVRKFAAKKL